MLIFRQNHAARGEQRPYVVPVEESAPVKAPRHHAKRNSLAGPPPTRDKAWNYTAPVLLEVERWLKQHGVSAAKFGRQAVGDPNLVSDLRGGRDPSSKVVARIRAFMSKGGAHD